MIYPWYEYTNIFEELELKTFEVEFEVDDENMCLYSFNGNKRVGSKGKTCWYLPLEEEDELCPDREKKYGLKIVKYPVFSDVIDEYRRLQKEFSIQKILYNAEMAPDIVDIILIFNKKKTKINWLSSEIVYPENSFFFAQLVEHIENDMKQMSGVYISESGNVYGRSVEEFKEKCLEFRINPYDLTKENLFFNNGKLKVIDLHKWDRTYKIIPPKSPKYIQIELNNTCNANCKMCNIPEMKREKGYMSDELYRRIIKEANELGVEYITPFLHGEPFLRKDYISKLKLINEFAPNSKITIFTNGSLITKDILKDLSHIKNIEQIVFSFPGGDKESYEQVTGLNFEHTVQNVKDAFEILDGQNLRISMPVCEENAESESDFYSLWKGYPCSSYKTYNYLGDKNNTLSQKCYEQCDRAFRTMTIMWDGRICLCCMDSEGRYVMGNLSQDSLLSIWNNEKYSKLRLEHGICRNAYEACKCCTLDLRTEEYNNVYSICNN